MHRAGVIRARGSPASYPGSRTREKSSASARPDSDPSATRRAPRVPPRSLWDVIVSRPVPVEEGPRRSQRARRRSLYRGWRFRKGRAARRTPAVEGRRRTLSREEAAARVGAGGEGLCARAFFCKEFPRTKCPQASHVNVVMRSSRSMKRNEDEEERRVGVVFFRGDETTGWHESKIKILILVLGSLY